MTPIQTEYKGCHFRSRLEARWAVFFDSLKIGWEYEPEGFDLGVHGYYLPDFRLVATNKRPPTWFEIKPLAGLSREERDKMWAFRNALIDDRKAVASFTAKGDPLTFLLFASLVSPNFDEDGACDFVVKTPQALASLLFVDDHDLHRAAVAARSARFEHGQKGATL